MSEEIAGSTPSRSSPKKLKMESEEEATGLLKEEDHSEEEYKKIEDDVEDEDDDGPAPRWRHSPPLLDMIDFPPSSTLPPTPPLPSSPGDLDMEQQYSDEDDGPPPGWDNNFQLKDQEAELLVTFATTSAISTDMQTEYIQQDAHNEGGEPLSQAHLYRSLEVAPSVEEHDSEDDGPPPGWDSKCQPEAKLEKTPQSDMKMEDGLKDAQSERQPTTEVPSVEREDSEDEGPPPGWDSNCQPEPKIQNIQSDINTNNVQQDARNENGSQSRSRSQSPSNPAPEQDKKVEEHDSEDDGPPPGWNFKSQLKPNLQMGCPTTPPSDFKNEEEKEDALHNEGSSPGWGSTAQQQSHVHSSLLPPIVHPGIDDKR